jgi:hypothetical protein
VSKFDQFSTYQLIGLAKGLYGKDICYLTSMALMTRENLFAVMETLEEEFIHSLSENYKPTFDPRI